MNWKPSTLYAMLILVASDFLSISSLICLAVDYRFKALTVIKGVLLTAAAVGLRRLVVG